MEGRSPSRGPLTGRLEGLALPDLLWVLSGGGKTGSLLVTSGERKRTLYLKDGQIIFAASNDPDERLGALLLRNNAVTLDDLDTAVRRLHSGKRIGTIMVEAGSLIPERLVAAVLEQVRGIALDLFTWEEGESMLERAFEEFRRNPIVEEQPINLKELEII